MTERQPKTTARPTEREMSDEAFAQAIVRGNPLFEGIVKPTAPVGRPVGSGGSPVGKR
jgi:hypothetical protein